MKIKIIKSILSVAILTAITSNAWAAGTASGTVVDNTATITYDVGLITQTPIGSSEGGNTSGVGTPTQFTVDTKIDLTVSEGADVTVTPGADDQDITYTLQNTGNSTEFFKLDTTQVAGDTFESSGCNISGVSLPAPALPAPALTGTDTVELIADQSVVVTVDCDIPLTATNTQISNLDLSATAVTDATGATAHTESAGDTAGVDIVLADGDAEALGDAEATDTDARNAIFSAVNTYVISTAALKVTKVSELISDPFNAAVNPKRIPGAIIKYTISVENTGAEATDIIITDILEAAKIEYDTSVASCAMSGDAVVAPTCSESGGTVTSTAFTLPDGSVTAKTETLTVYVKVKDS